MVTALLSKSLGQVIAKKFTDNRAMKASAFDKKFYAGEDITNTVDLSRAEAKRVNVDFPAWSGMLRAPNRLEEPAQCVIL